MPKPLELDGRTLEGGGQLVRVALTLSALCAIPIRIHHVRGKRASRGKPGGGLKESHLAALRVLQGWCAADVEGDAVGSTEITFVPRKGQRESMSCIRRNGDVREETIELKKPGSVWLVLQALLPFVLFSGILVDRDRTDVGGKVDRPRPSQFTLRLKGGTNVSCSMSNEYVQQVLLPTLEKIGLPKIEVELKKRGWAGNAEEIGMVEVRFPLYFGIGKDRVLQEFRVEGRAKLEKISVSVVAESPKLRKILYEAVHERLVDALPQQMFVSGSQKVDLQISEDSGDHRRLYVLIVAHTETGWRLGRDYLWSGKTCKNEKAVQAMVNEAAEVVVNAMRRELEKGGCVDEFMQDQLVVFQALANGKSEVCAGSSRGKGTLHARTVRWVCEEILGTQGLRFDEDGACEGVGWRAE